MIHRLTVWLILFVTMIYLWWSSLLTTGRPPVEMWPTNTPTPARVMRYPDAPSSERSTRPQSTQPRIAHTPAPS